MFKFCFGFLIIGITNAANIQSGGYGYEQRGLSSRLANIFRNRMGVNSLEQNINSLGLLSGVNHESKSDGLEMYSLGLSSAQPSGPLPAAIHTKRYYQVIPVPTNYEPAVPQVIEVGPTEQPVHIVFRSVSSPVHVQQIHTPGAAGQTEATHSEDEPHRVIHEVLRPVIQEVREVIQPYRKVTQEVRPVLEELLTRVAKKDHQREGVMTGGASLISSDSEGLALNLDSGKGGALSGLGLKAVPQMLSNNDLNLGDAYSGAIQSYEMNGGSSVYSAPKMRSK